MRRIVLSAALVVMTTLAGASEWTWSSGRSGDCTWSTGPSVDHVWVPSPPPIPPVIVVPPSQPVDLSGLSSQLDRLIADLAKHEAEEAKFREQARGVWKAFFQPVLEFTAKFIVPAVGAWFLGKEAAQQ